MQYVGLGLALPYREVAKYLGTIEESGASSPVKLCLRATRRSAGGHDRVVVAEQGSRIVGALRLCREAKTLDLQGMRVLTSEEEW